MGIADAPVDRVGAIWLVGMTDMLRLVDAVDTSRPLQLSVVAYLHQPSFEIHCLACIHKCMLFVSAAMCR